jgi:hypothetical protein
MRREVKLEATEFSLQYSSRVLFLLSRDRMTVYGVLVGNWIYWKLTDRNCKKSKSKSHCDWRSVSQSVSLGVEPHLGLMTRYLLLFDSYGLGFLWGALSDERTGLSFVYAAGPCQRRLTRVQVPWYSRPYFTVSELRLPFSSPRTTRRVTVEVFDPASTWDITTRNKSKSKSHCDWRSVSQ